MELRDSITQDQLNGKVSDRTRNSTQEVLNKMRGIFDQSMYLFFQKHVMPHITADQRERVKVYFPIVSRAADLNSVLGRAMIRDLARNRPEIYSFLDSVQPYQTDYVWMADFAKFANEKHIGLIKHKRGTKKGLVIGRGRNKITVPEGIDVVLEEGAIIDYAGKKLHGGQTLSVNSRQINADEGFPISMGEYAYFTLGDSQINVLWLCDKVVSEGTKIVRQFIQLL
jgi:hypothetical protein